ncbi:MULTISPECIES: zinc-binding dehydrogenase [unclassified Nocardioides]|uniref:zinc-binding dehydrogenase n=1 Tax=unclassified Nocardioides TaxID=2615069 RepID=UPI0006FB909D|nr:MULTISPECIES: zinc-binding dehydrogenase [unclassified Nocardioides]KRA31091.1 alcohol dehydrogenase [Nocardioides sp. Root614]KRA87711.1 alcohol dehydrogenase [Nocardioides sp. Root682]
MKAAVVREPGTITVEDIDIPTPGPRQVRVRLVATGVCHSDVTGLSGLVPVPTPVVLGHEGAGIVDAVGSAVTSLSPGDHVVLSITDGCGRCYQCQNGAFGLCEISAPRQLAGTLGDGTTPLSKGSETIHNYLLQSSFAEYAVVPEQCAVKIREDAPLEVAALLACGVTTGYGAVVRKARVAPFASVLIIGLGGVGLASVMAARLSGATTIIGVDRSKEACDLAMELGLTHTIVADESTDILGEVMALTGRGVDHAFDVVGISDTMNLAIAATRAGGEAVLIGLGDVMAVATVPLFLLLSEKRITGTTNGSIRPHVDIPAILDLFMEGRFPVDKLITRRYALGDIATALAEVGSGPGRGVITFDE